MKYFILKRDMNDDSPEIYSEDNIKEDIEEFECDEIFVEVSFGDSFTVESENKVKFTNISKKKINKKK
jgi:hypothetical protein